MAESALLVPDRRFVEAVVASGGGDLKKCFQCATCSVACELAPERHPFPRKEMLWAQWGLKDRLLANPDIWLCHQCNDCSVKCPRGARPGDVLAAIRQQAVRHWAVPKFLAAWVNDVRLVPVMLLVTAGLLGLALLAREPIEGAMGVTEHHGFYAEFIPHWLLNTFFPFFTLLSFVLLVAGLIRFWTAMRQADAAGGWDGPAAGLVTSVIRTVRAILVHDQFGKCGAQAARRWTHLAAFYGFLALFVVTVWAVVDIYVNPALGIDSLYPFGLLHPMKVLANVGGVLLIYGSAKAIVDRRHQDPKVGRSTEFDLIFLWVLFGVGVTGFATEVFRFTVDTSAEGAAVTAAYATYFVHLVLVFQLLVYLPYSKFAHIFFRTVAMIYAEHSGRNRPVQRLPAGSGVGLQISENVEKAVATATPQ